MTPTQRKETIALVTGALGGMGRACARELGRDHSLVLNDLDGEGLSDFAQELAREGVDVAGVVVGDLAQDGLAGELVGLARRSGRLKAAAHTAGLSPALAGWQDILKTNLVASEKLVLALEDALEPGFAIVLIASMAGHLAPVDAELDAVLAAPLRPDFMTQVASRLGQYAGPDERSSLAIPAYGLSKRAVIRLCAARAPSWGRKGPARIVSLSPGIIWTPMGQAEADNNPAARQVLEATPLGRWGGVRDIAAAVGFVLSDSAGFITGCDLRVDGGVTPVLQGLGV